MAKDIWKVYFKVEHKGHVYVAAKDEQDALDWVSNEDLSIDEVIEAAEENQSIETTYSTNKAEISDNDFYYCQFYTETEDEPEFEEFTNCFGEKMKREKRK